MARGGGGRRRTYARDANGRFASTPGGGLGAARKAARSTSGARGTLAARSSLKASRAKLRAKDPADQRLSTTLSARAQKGAVTRGNKALRAAKAASQRTAVGRSGVSTISQKRSPVMKATVLGGGKKVPAIDRPGSMANTLRQTMQALAKADAQRIREVESITGQKVRAPRRAPAGEGATVRAPGRRSVSGTLGDNLKKLAQSDARMMRGIGEIVRDATPKVSGRKGGKAIGGGKKALPQGEDVGLAKKIKTKKPTKSGKVDLTDAGFTRRLSRAKASLKRARDEYKARGSSMYDIAARKRVQMLESAVGALSEARKTVRDATVPASKIKTTDKMIIDNYNKNLSATKRKAASTPWRIRNTTAPRLTPSQKASATRAKNKAAKEAEQLRRWEQSRRRP